MAAKKHLFFEEQKQNGASAWIVLAGLAAISFSLMIVFYDEWNIQEKFTQKGILIFASIIISIFIGLYFMFLNIKMETKINDDGIFFRYPPFKRKYKKIALSEISSCEVIEYNPIKEYGGWGFKKPGKPRNKNIAYSMKGKMGLRIELKSGNIILLGTQRKDALAYSIKKLEINA